MSKTSGLDNTEIWLLVKGLKKIFRIVNKNAAPDLFTPYPEDDFPHSCHFSAFCHFCHFLTFFHFCPYFPFLPQHRVAQRHNSSPPIGHRPSLPLLPKTLPHLQPPRIHIWPVGSKTSIGIESEPNRNRIEPIKKYIFTRYHLNDLFYNKHWSYTQFI